MNLLSAIQKALALLQRAKRKQAEDVDYHELVIPVADEPHSSDSDEIDVVAAELDEEMFAEWYKCLVFHTGIIFQECEARKLFQVKDRARKREVVD